MSFNEIIVAVVTSAGGIGLIMWLLAKSIGKQISDDLTRKYQHGLDKKLEEFKSNLEFDRTMKASEIENKQYITKVKFDIEVQVYRELSKNFMEMVKCCSFLFTKENYYFDGKRENDFWIKKSIDAIKATDAAQTTLYQNAAFISENLYIHYDNVLQKSQDIIFALTPLSPKGRKEWGESEKEMHISNQVLASKELLDDMEKLNNTLRIYLNSLIII